MFFDSKIKGSQKIEQHAVGRVDTEQNSVKRWSSQRAFNGINYATIIGFQKQEKNALLMSFFKS